MNIFEIDGREIELEGIENDTIVIARPTRPLGIEESRNFYNSITHLSKHFARHHCTLIGADFDSVTFEVIKSKQVQGVADELPRS